MRVFRHGRNRSFVAPRRARAPRTAPSSSTHVDFVPFVRQRVANNANSGPHPRLNNASPCIATGTRVRSSRGTRRFTWSPLCQQWPTRRRFTVSVCFGRCAVVGDLGSRWFYGREKLCATMAEMNNTRVPKYVYTVGDRLRWRLFFWLVNGGCCCVLG